MSFNGNEIIGYKLNDIIKCNKDTFSMISKFANDEFNIFKKNIASKAYVDCKDLFLRVCTAKEKKVSAIFIIKREKGIFRIETIKIRDNIQIEIALITNIVGIAQFTNEMIKIIRINKLFSNIIEYVDFYYLYIPDDFCSIEASSKKIVEEIERISILK